MRADSKGYTFAVWLRLEDVGKASAPGGRSLYSLLSTMSEGAKGFSAAFKGVEDWMQHPKAANCDVLIAVGLNSNHSASRVTG